MIIPGHLALVARSDPKPYEEGVYFLAQTITQTLSLAFFYYRLTRQLTNGSLSGVDYAQARYSHIACHNMIAINMNKLIEKRKDSWNFHQLYKEWCRFIHDVNEQQVVLGAINDLRVKLSSISDYRRGKIAHQSKNDEIGIATALPREIKYLDDIVRIMDMFIDGQIPYSLYLHESSEKLDLRSELNLDS